MNWYKKSQLNSILISSINRPTIYQGDIEGISSKAKTIGFTYASNGEKIEIKTDNEKNVYALIDEKEVGYAQSLDDNNFDVSVAKEFQRIGIGTILMTIFLKLNPIYKSKKGDFTEIGYNTFQKSLENLENNNELV